MVDPLLSVRFFGGWEDRVLMWCLTEYTVRMSLYHFRQCGIKLFDARLQLKLQY